MAYFKVLYRHSARVGEVRNAYKMLAGKYEGGRSLGRSKRRREDTVRLNFGERE
jgi:hypothetical protein